MTKAPSYFQSFVLLPFARRIFLWAAGVAFIVTIGAFLVGGVMFARGTYVPKSAPPNPVQLSDDAGWDPSNFPPEVDVQILRTKRSDVAAGTAVAILASKYPLDSIQKLALLPSGDGSKFSLESISGPDPTDDDDALNSVGTRYRVIAKEGAVSQLRNSNAFVSFRISYTATFSRKVGQQAVTGQFSLDYPGTMVEQPTSAVPSEEAPAAEMPAEQAPEAGPVAQAAQEVAIIVDANHGPLFFKAYANAKEQIATCSPDADKFALALRAQLKVHGKKLTKETVFRFVGRVCALWRTDELRVQKQLMENAAADAAAMTDAMAAKATSMIAMYVAGAALTAFLMFALALALLAIENHTLALRVREGSN